jgi:hypothetical protein
MVSSGADDEMGGSRHWMTPGSRPDALKLQPACAQHATRSAAYSTGAKNDAETAT